jgi:bile acid:Na+ symporter, BASS family
MEFLSKAAAIVMPVFVVSCMLAVGMSLTVREILAPLRNGRLVSLALLANFVLMPLCAVAIAKALRLDEPLGAALLLLGVAAGAPFLPKLASRAKGDLAFSVALTALLMVVSVGYMPLVLPLLLQGVTVDVMKIARSLLVLMFLPLCFGLAVKAFLERIADSIRSWLNRISNISLWLLILLMLITNFRNVINLFGTRGILASIVFLVCGSVAGWLMGGPAAGTRSVLALGTAARNFAAGLVVGEDFDDPRVIVMVVVVAVISLLALMPLARVLARRSTRQDGAGRSASGLAKTL